MSANLSSLVARTFHAAPLYCRLSMILMLNKVKLFSRVKIESVMYIRWPFICLVFLSKHFLWDKFIWIILFSNPRPTSVKLLEIIREKKPSIAAESNCTFIHIWNYNYQKRNLHLIQRTKHNEFLQGIRLLRQVIL